MRAIRKFGFVLALLTISVFIPQKTFAISPGSKAPDITVVDPSGKEITLSSLKGKVVYLDFWASWCGPCKHTLPWMNEIQEKFTGKPFQILAVNLDSNPEDAASLIEEIHPNYQVAYDNTKKAVELYSPPKMPTSYLIGKDGALVEVYAGFHPSDEEKIEKQISELLKK